METCMSPTTRWVATAHHVMPFCEVAIEGIICYSCHLLSYKNVKQLIIQSSSIKCINRRQLHSAWPAETAKLVTSSQQSATELHYQRLVEMTLVVGWDDGGRMPRCEHYQLSDGWCAPSGSVRASTLAAATRPCCHGTRHRSWVSGSINSRTSLQWLHTTTRAASVLCFFLHRTGYMNECVVS